MIIQRQKYRVLVGSSCCVLLTEVTSVQSLIYLTLSLISDYCGDLDLQ